MFNENLWKPKWKTNKTGMFWQSRSKYLAPLAPSGEDPRGKLWKQEGEATPFLCLNRDTGLGVGPGPTAHGTSFLVLLPSQLLIPVDDCCPPQPGTASQPCPTCQCTVASGGGCVHVEDRKVGSINSIKPLVDSVKEYEGGYWEISLIFIFILALGRLNNGFTTWMVASPQFKTYPHSPQSYFSEVEKGINS